ncbi:hypothetical protein CIB84_006911 [Bambusicola thoracicus]|uniref:Uncharacterized protein n=1 Tax=Bambusicola thoracicus TaxID=9083 RepID=A0A2P4SYZ0_BAMTH|nr:hypothetical protein CIB84_006911 [Bambusicola thoracicus]
MSAELKPSVVENACKLQHQVSHFFVGCPPGRHIVVEIYDVDTYVGNVEANFVLWEIKGRTDDGYTSSMRKVSQLLGMLFNIRHKFRGNSKFTRFLTFCLFCLEVDKVCTVEAE